MSDNLKWYNKDIEPKCSKGLFAQIQDVKFEPKPFNIDDFNKWWDEANKRRQEQFKLREKTIKHNIEHLVKRSHELKKEVPIELQLMVTHTYPLLVGSEFLKKYEEWIK